jgi:thiosulfate dehydrogenase
MIGKIALFAILALTVVCGYWLATSLYLDEKHVTVLGSTGKDFYSVDIPGRDEPLDFGLVDPESAPEAMMTKIMFGYHLMLDTKANAPNFAGNTVTCNNCHFNAGNTLGGKNRGISLVGVTTRYPQFSKRDNKRIFLADRINNCFKRSLNGKPLPKGSLEMESILAYLAWISHEVEDGDDLPWLGLKKLTSQHVPDPTQGAITYDKCCSICHGYRGQGSMQAPPLWGTDSFNDGAGMNTLPMLSSFIYDNMPYGEPILTEEEALDVASFIILQKRPKFVP